MASTTPQKAGAMRNLTTHFLRLRSRMEADRKRRMSSPYSLDDDRPLMGAGAGSGAGAGAGAGAGWEAARRSVPPMYVDIVTQVQRHMDDIVSKSECEGGHDLGVVWWNTARTMRTGCMCWGNLPIVARMRACAGVQVAGGKYDTLTTTVVCVCVCVWCVFVWRFARSGGFEPPAQTTHARGLR
mgnify:CR=1 FL=1